MAAQFYADQGVQVSGDLTELRRYWSDPVFQAACDAERATNRARINAAIDRGMAALNAKQAARWAAEEAQSGACNAMDAGSARA